MQDRTFHVALITGLLSLAAGCALIWLVKIEVPRWVAEHDNDEIRRIEHREFMLRKELTETMKRYDECAAARVRLPDESRQLIECKAELGPCRDRVAWWEKRWVDLMGPEVKP